MFNVGGATSMRAMEVTWFDVRCEAVDSVAHPRRRAPVLARVARFTTELPFDLQQLVVLRQSLTGTARPS